MDEKDVIIKFLRERVLELMKENKELKEFQRMINKKYEDLP